MNYLTLILLFGSAFAGGLVVLLWVKEIKKALKFLLAFSGAFLLGISALHLFPEVYQSGVENVGVFILAGFLLQLVLEYFSQGIEHGHMHHSHDHSPTFPIGVMLSLCLHAFLEGMPIDGEMHHHAHVHDTNEHSLLIGVVLHKLPVALALVSMLLGNGLSKSKALVWLTIFCLMAPLGMVAGYFISASGMAISENFFAYMVAVVVGMFLHIATTILFESSESHKFNAIKLITVVAGLGVAVLVS